MLGRNIKLLSETSDFSDTLQYIGNKFVSLQSKIDMLAEDSLIDET
jgi:hypothetical protein